MVITFLSLVQAPTKDTLKSCANPAAANRQFRAFDRFRYAFRLLFCGYCTDSRFETPCRTAAEVHHRLNSKLRDYFNRLHCWSTIPCKPQSIIAMQPDYVEQIGPVLFRIFFVGTGVPRCEPGHSFNRNQDERQKTTSACTVPRYSSAPTSISLKSHPLISLNGLSPFSERSFQPLILSRHRCRQNFF